MESWRFRKGVFTVFFLLIPFSCFFHYPPIPEKLAEYLKPAGAGITIVSAIFAFYIHNMFPRTHKKPEDFEKLLTDGPYRYVRHPFYSAFIIMGFGIALFCLSVPGLIAYILMLPLWEKLAGFEERELLDYWGEEYLEFMKTRGRFFPKLGVKM